MMSQARWTAMLASVMVLALALASGCSSGGKPADDAGDAAFDGADGTDAADAGGDPLADGTDAGDEPADAGGDPADAGGDEDPGPSWSCNTTYGLSAPLPVCSATDPCLRPAAELAVDSLSEPSVLPVCRTTAAGAPVFDDGEPLRWTGPGGVERAACLYVPAGTSKDSTRPLLVWLHGGGAGLASDVYDFTTIRHKAVGYDLSADPARPGFILLSVQGRNLHYPTANRRDGHHHDFYYRDLAAPSTNPDVANLDRLIDELVAEGIVDSRRIYLMGWSNGGFFAQLYAVARFSSKTPGGNNIAAAAVFSAADPFHNIREGQRPSCQLNPYPTSTVPVLVLSRACDVVACDAAQAQGLTDAGLIIEPGHVVERWMVDLAGKVADPNGRREIAAGTGELVRRCTDAADCTALVATVNHLRWPNGVADGSGYDHEPLLLDFLRAHPLP